jgi:hypothetical protein
MLDAFSRRLVNLFYLVPFAVKRFKRRETDSQVLIADATKAQKLEEDIGVKRGLGWVLSRRGVLILTSKKLLCGSWEIPLSTVSKATLIHTRTLLLIKGLVLKVSTVDGQCYQFGLQYNPAWERQTVLKLTNS